MKTRFGKDFTKVPGTHFWRLPQIGRRMFFRHIATAMGGYFLMPHRPMERVAKGASGTPIGTAKNCIFILMAGAPSHSDTFDLKVGPWTPSFMNPTTYGDIQFPQGIMPKLADQLGQGSISFLRSVKAWAAVHGLSQTWAQIGRNPVNGLSKIAPHIGSVVALELGSKSDKKLLPPFVSLNTGNGPGPGYLSPDNAPFYVSPGGNGLGNTMNPNGLDAFNRRFNLLQSVDAEARSGAIGSPLLEMAQFNKSARDLMYNPDVDKVFNFDQNTRNSYGNTGFGNACVVARNLIRGDLGTRFIQITVGGWDMHQSIYTPGAALQGLTKQYDSGLGQLIADLKADGTFDSTLIVSMGEFGRTVGPPNQGAGRDHFLQMSVLMAGAKITGGKAIGSTDDLAKDIVDPGWSRNREIHFEDIEATIYSALGIDWTTVRHDDPLGRGFEYVPFAATEDLYGPVNELWS